MIAFAIKDDIDEIMDFIDKEWRKGHILARDRVFFEWMYVKEEKVNFVISRDEGRIDGILGFVPYDENNNQIALTVWKALKSANGMVGMSMLLFIEKQLAPILVATPGANPVSTAAIYKYFKYEVGKMGHYYRLASRDKYYIPTINAKIEKKQVRDAQALVKQIKTFEEYKELGIVLADNAIKKDDWYIRRRYFEHPVFEYLHYIVENETKLDVVMRVQEVDGHKCIRIVDLLGDFARLTDFTKELDVLLKDGGYEYIDCYASAVDKRIWLNAGWLDVEETGDIIPNYFAPFVRENIDIYYSCKPHGIAVLRGDGDQDRPN